MRINFYQIIIAGTVFLFLFGDFNQLKKKIKQLKKHTTRSKQKK